MSFPRSTLLRLAGGAATLGAPADVAKFIAADTDKWIKVVQFAHLKVD